ncbi:ABC-2 transporter permease [candidate division KSB1 bacterium]
MLGNLVLKDLRAFGRAIIIIGLLNLCLNSIYIIYGKTRIEEFLLIGTGQITFYIILLALIEKTKHGEKLLTSLPLNRNFLVLGRFISALIVSLAGLIFLFATGLFFLKYTDYSPVDVDFLTNINLMFLLVSYLIIFVCIFIPLSYAFNRIWVFIISLYICIFAFIFSFLYLDMFDFLIFPQNNLTMITNIIGLLLISAASLYFSFSISIKIYNKREI